MFIYDDNGTYKGFTTRVERFFTTEVLLRVSAFSVDKEIADKELKKRLRKGTIYEAMFYMIPILVSIAIGISVGVNYHSFISGFLSTLAAFLVTVWISFMIYAFEAGDYVEELLDEESYYDKYAIVKQEKLINIEYPDYHYGLDVSSILFSEINDKFFWKKFLNITDEKILREATDIMILESKLHRISMETNNYLNSTQDSILESEIKNKHEIAKQKLEQLSERCETFVETVLKSIDNEKDMKVLEVVEELDTINV